MFSKEYKIMKLENRISVLEARQPMKDNYNVVTKLKRRLKHLKEN